MKYKPSAIIFGILFWAFIITSMVLVGRVACDFETRDNISQEKIYFEQVFMNHQSDWTFISDGSVYRYSWIAFKEYPRTRIFYDVHSTDRQWAKIVHFKHGGEMFARVEEIHIFIGSKIGAGSYSAGKFGNVNWHEVGDK